MPPIPKDEEAEEENPYMALRAAKIARNQARLKKLGLVKTPLEYVPSKSNVQRSKKPLPKKSPPPTAIMRRSNRLSNQSNPPDYKEKALPRDYPAVKDELSLPAPKRRRTSSATAGTPPPPAANSVRSIDLDIEQLVLGNKNNDNDNGGQGLLGQQMEQTGKEFVIYQTFEKASSPEDRNRLEGARLSFNKYCGVQEWRNAVFLWVNLGNKDNPVVNDFLNEGQQITWFGGSRMHDESPVIMKLLKMGQDTTTTTTTTATTGKSSSSQIVLWCRKYQVQTKQFTPYVCFGRLGYESHEPGSHPLSFVWNLLDYQRLKNHSETQIRERFQFFTS
ncbi:unnamed protein product [Cylindrotheca closterium]|uniref:Uncharacterized protein n=1 Tax=Cylindrotheca closterium TaxID=2856 RepID=A0AAD2G4Y9_9STRA|nr:unnamed protein product [Cylindrotheca closterium]